MRTLVVVWWLSLGSGLAVGCSSPAASCTDPQLVGALDIAFRDQNDTLFPAVDGGEAPVVIGPQSQNMLVATLRARELDPLAPEPSVQVFLDGRLIAANTAGTAVDLVPDGDAWALKDLGVVFQVEPCCFSCREVVVQAKLVDRLCHECASNARVVLRTFGACPSSTPCCYDALDCPDPSWTQLCQ